MGQLKTVIVAGLLVVVVILGVLAFTVFRAPAAATTPITAIPLAASSAAAEPAATTASASTAASAAPAETAASSAAATTEPAASTASETAAASTILAQIVSAESEARFVIDEVLNNAPKTVVGATDQVAGEIAVDPNDPTKTQVGVIQVNARTLTTDSEFRNRAIKNQILSTDQYEFVTFTPTAVTGLPAAGTVGQSYTFQITGDLQIRDVTKQVTFDVTATPVSETRLEGTAQTTITYADWGITIPQVRQVASVSDEVRLEIDFVATPNA